MIVRVLTARVRSERAGAADSGSRQQLPILREQPGLVYVKLARNVGPTHEEIVLFEEWRDTAALYAWAGQEIIRPRLLPGTEELVDDLVIAHYEALDVDPDADVDPGMESP